MICLTFDTDYLSCEDIERFLTKYSFPGQVTFFVHEYYPVLETTGHEICPHPFIENLNNWENSVNIIEKRYKSKPNGLRAHSCVFSHMIGIGMKTLGYKYVSQAQHLYQPGLKPYRHPWGIWEMPIYYMDNMDYCMADNWKDMLHSPFGYDVIERALDFNSLFVFDFHPLHIILNTRNLDGYSSVKELIINKKASPYDLRFNGKGSGVFFEQLCEAMIRSNQRSYTCTEALDYFLLNGIY